MSLQNRNNAENGIWTVSEFLTPAFTPHPNRLGQGEATSIHIF